MFSQARAKFHEKKACNVPEVVANMRNPLNKYPAMTESWKKLRGLAKRRGMTISDVACATGVAVSTLRNLGSGSSSSKRLRRCINDFFGEEVYPGVGGISGHVLRIPAGCEIEFSREDQALEFARAFGSNVTIAGKMLWFVLPTRVAVQFPISTNQKESNK